MYVRTVYSSFGRGRPYNVGVVSRCDMCTKHVACASPVREQHAACVRSLFSGNLYDVLHCFAAEGRDAT